jgi:hypothetical protein
MEEEYEYTELTLEQKIEGIRSRVVELEGQHFSNTVYRDEALSIGDVKAAEKFQKANKPLEIRLDHLLDKIAKFQAKLDELAPTEEVLTHENEPEV